MEKIANLTHRSEIQLACPKEEGIVYKLIEGMPYAPTWDSVKKRL